MTFIKYPKTNSVKDFKVALNRAFSGRVEYKGQDENGEPILEKNPIKATMVLEGTVKLHGTHMDVHNLNGGITVQSRNRIITVNDDSFAFAQFVEFNKDWFEKALGTEETIISGEWAGGNIQKGVAISGMPKAFFFFNKELRHLEDPERRIFYIGSALEVTLKLNTEYPEPTFKLIEELTEEIDKNCPWGAKLNPNSENTIGEGLVFKAFHEGKEFFMFKSKGDSHKRSSGQPKQPKVVDPALDSKVGAFIGSFLTVDRLEQGLEYLREMNIPIARESTGEYIKWVTTDLKEETINDLSELGLEWRQVAGAASKLAKEYFMQTVENS